MNFKKITSKIGAGMNILAAHVYGKRTPLSVSFRVTFRCNLTCSYCQVWKSAKPEQELTTKQYFKIIDELAKLGTQIVSFTGGEPLLRKDIGEIIRYSKSKGLFTMLVTNGVFVPHKINDLKNIDILCVSLDGPEELHDLHKGKGVFKKAIEAIKLATDSGITTWSYTTVTKKNINDLDYMLDLAEKTGFTVSLNILMVTHLAKEGTEEFALTKNEIRQLYEKLIKDKKAGKPIEQPLSLLEYFHKTYAMTKPSDYKCWAGKLYGVVNPNGDLFPCAALVDKMQVPNIIKEGSFKKALYQMPDLNCPGCNFSCYTQKNMLFSLNPALIEYVVKNYAFK